MREKRDVWVCEFVDCGHVWLVKSDGPPRQCGKCRRPGWHKTATTAELIRESPARFEDRMREIATEVYRTMQPTPTVRPQPVASPIPTPQPTPMVEDSRIVIDEYSEMYQAPIPQPRYAPTLQPAWSQPQPSPVVLPPSATPSQRMASLKATLTALPTGGSFIGTAAMLNVTPEPDDDIYAT